MRQVADLWTRARELMPGGVNSPVRARATVDGEPVIAHHGEGPFLFSVDGRRFIDLIMSWGPLILGHANPVVLEAIRRAAERGTTFGLSTAAEVELAERITTHIPSVEMVRMVNSGTEATMSAIRLARAATGRDLIVKFAGSYHGHADALLVQAGSGMAALGLPASPGVTQASVAHTAVLPYGDAKAAAAFFAERGDEVAAVIVEPVAGNMGVVAPAEDFLPALRDLTQKAGSVLIFDEVITGFRLGLGGAQQRFGITPDLTCLGKVIGGGLPVGAYGGRKDLMSLVAPLGDVYQAGTLSGNPIAMAAGAATLDVLSQDGFYDVLEAKARRLAEGIEQAAASSGVRVTVNRVGTLLTAFMTKGPVRNFDDVLKSDQKAYRRLYEGLARRHVLIPPAPFEALFVSAAHHDRHIDDVAEAYAEALAEVKRG